MLYTLKPVEAIQVQDHGENILEVQKFCESVGNTLEAVDNVIYLIGKAETIGIVQSGMWLVKGEKMPFNVNDDIVLYTPEIFPYTEAK